ncbi:class I SAM-dependent methyltransferase [Ornithinibacillus salinisoli]|uniref:Class I SAM-dependent methyltransferase n=2 Tax=Ornithinibacillus salinisoli TaxID=1848459 RepID=A0ABW4W0W8_9BACI
MKEKVIDTFNQLAIVYEKSIDTEGLYNSEYERPTMLEQLPKDLLHKDVLDAGCAAGWYTHQLVNRGAKVIATDVSPEMIRTTQRRVGDKAKVICMDLEGEMAFEENSFDIIISSLTLHYVKDWEVTFNEFKRILKPNGMLLFSVHHPFTDLRLLQNASYFSTELITDVWKKDGKTYEVPFYRRPLHTILNTTLKYFSIEKVIEPQPTLNFKERAPEKYEHLLKNPQFLIIKAISK